MILLNFQLLFAKQSKRWRTFQHSTASARWLPFTASCLQHSTASATWLKDFHLFLVCSFLPSSSALRDGTWGPIEHAVFAFHILLFLWVLILQSLLDIIFRKESIEELKRLLEQAKKETAAARLELEETKKKKEVVVAIRDGFLGTPSDRVVRRFSSEDLSSAEPSSKRSKVQFGLRAFWGSPEEQALAEPVTLSEDPRLRNRQQKSQRQIELEELRSKGEELLKAVQDELPVVDEASKAYEAKEFFREMGRRGGRPKGSGERRVELSARQKLDIVEE